MIGWVLDARHRWHGAWVMLAVAVHCLLGAANTYAQSGYQTIQGTQVYTVIDQAAGVATFSNDCGTQRLTQRELQAGAIPDQIIPCPRPGQSATQSPRPRPKPSVAPPLPWGAVAAYDDVYVWVRGHTEAEVKKRAASDCAARTGKACSVTSVQPNMCVCIFTVNYMSGSKHRTQVIIRKDWMNQAACDEAYSACNKAHPGQCRGQEEHCANKRI